MSPAKDLERFYGGVNASLDAPPPPKTISKSAAPLLGASQERSIPMVVALGGLIHLERQNELGALSLTLY